LGSVSPDCEVDLLSEVPSDFEIDLLGSVPSDCELDLLGSVPLDCEIDLLGSVPSHCEIDLLGSVPSEFLQKQDSMRVNCMASCLSLNYEKRKLTRCTHCCYRCNSRRLKRPQHSHRTVVLLPKQPSGGGSFGLWGCNNIILCV
jgi:hypothetical protein